VTKASASDTTHLAPLIEDLAAHHPRQVEIAEECAGDKGYDSAENKENLYESYGIKPIIDHRRLWKEEPDQPRPLFPDRADVVLYNETGQLFCQCPSERRGEDELREMAFVGFEKDRQTLKYRCPAASWGSDCPGRALCEANTHAGAYGRIVRVPLDHDRRIFTPIARPSAKWRKAYDRRTAVERVNSRIDCVLGFEHHTIRGQAKMEVRIGLALVIMLAMALGRVRVGQLDQLRSLVAPVRLAAA
jgi:hypothetical protein